MWGVFKRVMEENPNIVPEVDQAETPVAQVEERVWFAFSKPLAKTFLGTELEAEDFVTSPNLWVAPQKLDRAVQANGTPMPDANACYRPGVAQPAGSTRPGQP